MSNEDAEKIIDKVIATGTIVTEAADYSFWDTVKTAIGKQIPKKPTYNGTYQCPNCGCSQDREPRGGTVNGVHHDYVYCWYCGTAIDWSNSNDY